MVAIYKISNNVTDDCYIGVTGETPSELRFKGHKKASRYGSKCHIHRAMRKYGAENFSFSVLELGENEEYLRKVAEPMYIAWLRPKYNMTLGGEGSFGLCEASRSQKSLALKTSCAATEQRKQLHLKSKGTPKTIEHRRALSVSHKNSLLVISHIKKLADSRRGIHKPICDALRNGQRGIEKPRVACPHCAKTGGKPVMLRWHFDNCKGKL